MRSYIYSNLCLCKAKNKDSNIKDQNEEELDNEKEIPEELEFTEEFSNDNEELEEGGTGKIIKFYLPKYVIYYCYEYHKLNRWLS